MEPEVEPCFGQRIPVSMDLVVVLFLVCILIFLRCWMILPSRILSNTPRRSKTQKESNVPFKDTRFSTLVVLGSGGHTAEMIKLITKLSTNVYAPRHYVLADSDFHSESRVRKELMRGDDNHRSTRFWTIPRSREVGQSWISTPWTSAWAFFACLKLIGQIQPDVVLCNGPGTCVPLALAVKLRQFLGHSARTKIIFCESLARVRGLSLTGKLAYYGFADRVVVHWPALQQRYPSSEYLGVIC